MTLRELLKKFKIYYCYYIITVNDKRDDWDWYCHKCKKWVELKHRKYCYSMLSSSHLIKHKKQAFLEFYKLDKNGIKISLHKRYKILWFRWKFSNTYYSNEDE